MSGRDPRNTLTRRAILLSAAALPLAGCGSRLYGLSVADWGNMFGTAVGLEPVPGVTRQQAAQIPYATIGYRVGDSGEGVLLLAENSQGNALWTSIKRQAILTNKGRIRQTAGFRWNLTTTNFLEDDPVGTTRLVTDLPGPFDRTCDYVDIHKFQVTVRSSFQPESEEPITILETDLKTLRVAEHCRCEQLDWNFQNYYWIDPATGFVWKSIQHTHPNLEPFTIQILRPEG